MPKTYNTIPTTTTGSVYTAAAHNNIVTNVNNYRVPPACQVRRTANLTGYTSTADIAWNSAAYDTESPSDPMWAASPNAERVTIRTAGVYLVVFKGYLTASATLTIVQPSIEKNGTSVCDIYGTITGGAASLWSSAVVLSLAASDYIGASVFISGGSGYVINGNATEANIQTTLTATWLGQAS